MEVDGNVFVACRIQAWIWTISDPLVRVTECICDAVNRIRVIRKE